MRLQPRMLEQGVDVENRDGVFFTDREEFIGCRDLAIGIQDFTQHSRSGDSGQAKQVQHCFGVADTAPKPVRVG